ncbi:hypothetical protein BH11MYX1_BH11MYX1_35460 [soil metagenome]
MAVVPKWFGVLSHVLAVVFALWLGLHIYAPLEWILICSAVAVLSALLPYFRIVGFVGLAGGIVIGVVGTYLLRDVWKGLSVSGLLEGGGATAQRDAVVLVFASLWLVLGSAFRTQRA